MLSPNNTFTLNSKALRGIPLNKYESNFTFIVNGKKFKTNRFIADILSPIIRNYHYSDESINSFEIKSQRNDENNIKKRNDEKYFIDFLNLATFDDFELDLSHQNYFSEYFYLLGNTDEFLNLHQQLIQDLKTDNVVDRLNALLEQIEIFQQFSSTSENIIGKMIQFIASNFEMIDKNSMITLPIYIIEQIASNKSLSIDNEDSLMDFLLLLYENDHSNSFLFDYVLFANLTTNGIQSFVNTFKYDEINANIWKSVCNRLLGIKKFKQVEKSRYNKVKLENSFKEFLYDDENKFNGIFNYLTDKTKGNILQNNTINIISNSINKDYPLANIVKFEGSKYDYYRTNNSQRVEIIFDFKDKLVSLNGYSIKTGTSCSGASHLKNWQIEVSKDGKTWNVVDIRRNNSSLNNELASSFFAIQNPINEFYQFVKLYQTGESWWGSTRENLFEIHSIEFYGKLIEK